MSGPLNINVAKAEQSAGKLEGAQQVFAKQVQSEERQTNVENIFDPERTQREQEKNEKFDRLENRFQKPEQKEKELEDQQIEKVEKKADEDLANRFAKRNYELPPDQLRSLRSALKSGVQPEALLAEIQKTFPDPTLANEAIDYLKRVGGEEFQEVITQAKEILNERYALQIKAGQNVNSVAQEFHQKGVGESPTELRDLYRELVENPERKHNELFRLYSRRYKYPELKKRVRYLLNALGSDLRSKGPSIERPELLVLLTEVRNLQSILWTYSFFKGRVKTIKAMFKLADFTSDKEWSFGKLAKGYMRLVEEPYPSVRKVLDLLEKMGLSEDVEKIAVLTQYRDANRALSNRLFDTPKQKANLHTVILTTLEQLEPEEEE